MKKLIVYLMLFLSASQQNFAQANQQFNDKNSTNFFNIEQYQHNPCVRLYKPEDFDQASRVLQANGLDYSMSLLSCITLVYEKNDMILGVCIFEFETGYVHRLSVGKDYQHQGIGKALLCEVMHILYTKYNIGKVRLYSLLSAIPFYKKLGFIFKGQDAMLAFV